MNTLFRFATVALIAASASACVTARITRLQPLAAQAVVPGKQTVVALAYQLDGFRAQDGTCVLEVVDQASTRYSFPLESDRQAVLLELPLGTYRAKQLYCPDLSVRWELDRLWESGIEPVDGKINYAGFFKATLTHGASGPSMRTQTTDRAAASEGARKLLSSMPGAWAPHWVSVATGRPIRKSMFPQAEKSYGLKFKTEIFSKQEGLNSAGLQDAIKACEARESESNFLLLGNLAYYSRYEGGRLAEFKKDAEDEAFREDFPRCVESAMRSHVPAFQDKMEFRVTY